MKALELGGDVPEVEGTTRSKVACRKSPVQDGDQGSLARKCFSTALWVAFWGFLAAGGVGGTRSGEGVALAIAVSTGAIGVAAVICGTILAACVPVRTDPSLAAKHDVEDDAYDVVSSRGY